MIKKVTMLFGLMSISNAAMEENEVNVIAGPIKKMFIQQLGENYSLDKFFLNIRDRVTFQEKHGDEDAVLTGAVVGVNPLAIIVDDTSTVYEDTINPWSVKRLYQVDDQVRVLWSKDPVTKSITWKRGTVTKTDPLFVKVDGMEDPKDMNDNLELVEYAYKDYNIGDRVRVSTWEEGPWSEGTVTQLKPLKVHADGMTDIRNKGIMWRYVQSDWEHKFDKLVKQASEYANLQKLYKKAEEEKADLGKEKADLVKEKADLVKEKAGLEEKNAELAKKDDFEDQSKKNYNLMIVFVVLFAICAIAVIALSVVLVKKSKQNA